MKIIPFLVIKLFHFISSLRFLLEKYKKPIVYVAKLSNSFRVNYSDRHRLWIFLYSLNHWGDFNQTQHRAVFLVMGFEELSAYMIGSSN